MPTPILRQDWDLGGADFDESPIWLAVHGTDEGAAWYEDCDEATFRPWDREMPAKLQVGTLLVSAAFTLSDGRSYPGAVYVRFPPEPQQSDAGLPSADPSDSAIAELQPRIFLTDLTLRFWGGLQGISTADRELIFSELGCPETIFPIAFNVVPGLIEGSRPGIVNGFYRLVSISTGRQWIADTSRIAPEDGTGPSMDISDSLPEPDRLREVTGLAQRGECQEALDRANQLIRDRENEAYRVCKDVYEPNRLISFSQAQMAGIGLIVVE